MINFLSAKILAIYTTFQKIKGWCFNHFSCIDFLFGVLNGIGRCIG